MFCWIELASFSIGKIRNYNLPRNGFFRVFPTCWTLLDAQPLFAGHAGCCRTFC
jgi:hypothetical protein